MYAYNNFKKYQPLLKELVMRDIKIKYRKSILGVLWTVLNPLFMMMIMSVVFSTIFKNGIENYPVYIFSGQIIFNFFSESTSSSITAILGNASLIKKVYVPKYIFVLARVLSSLINLMASSCAFIVVLMVTGIELHYKMILGILPIVTLCMLSAGIGLILSAITVKFRDIEHFYSVFLTGLLYLCPIIYPMSFLPPVVRKVVSLNPLTNMLIMFRDVMTDNLYYSGKSTLIAILEALVFLGIGLFVFYKRQDKFIMEV